MNARFSSFRLLAAVTASMLAFQAQASFIEVNLAGFESAGNFGSPSNSQVFLSIAPGSTVTSWDFLNLTFSTGGASFLNEFVISVNNSNASEYLDAAPSDLDDSGTFGPASGSWATALGGTVGAPFVVADGTVWVTVYESFVDAGVNAIVSAGTLRINYDSATAIPEPGTFGLMVGGLLGAAAAARRRKTR